MRIRGIRQGSSVYMQDLPAQRTGRRQTGLHSASSERRTFANYDPNSIIDELLKLALRQKLTANSPQVAYLTNDEQDEKVSQFIEQKMKKQSKTTKTSTKLKDKKAKRGSKISRPQSHKAVPNSKLLSGKKGKHYSKNKLVKNASSNKQPDKNENKIFLHNSDNSETSIDSREAQQLSPQIQRLKEITRSISQQAQSRKCVTLSNQIQYDVFLLEQKIKQKLSGNEMKEIPVQEDEEQSSYSINTEELASEDRNQQIISQLQEITAQPQEIEVKVLRAKSLKDLGTPLLDANVDRSLSKEQIQTIVQEICAQELEKMSNSHNSNKNESFEDKKNDILVQSPLQQSALLPEHSDIKVYTARVTQIQEQRIELKDDDATIQLREEVQHRDYVQLSKQEQDVLNNSIQTSNLKAIGVSDILQGLDSIHDIISSQNQEVQQKAEEELKDTFNDLEIPAQQSDGIQIQSTNMLMQQDIFDDSDEDFNDLPDDIEINLKSLSGCPKKELVLENQQPDAQAQAQNATDDAQNQQSIDNESKSANASSKDSDSLVLEQYIQEDKALLQQTKSLSDEQNQKSIASSTLSQRERQLLEKVGQVSLEDIQQKFVEDQKQEMKAIYIPTNQYSDELQCEVVNNVICFVKDQQNSQIDVLYFEKHQFLTDVIIEILANNNLQITANDQVIASVKDLKQLLNLQKLNDIQFVPIGHQLQQQAAQDLLSSEQFEHTIFQQLQQQVRQTCSQENALKAAISQLNKFIMYKPFEQQLLKEASGAVVDQLIDEIARLYEQ